MGKSNKKSSFSSSSSSSSSTTEVFSLAGLSTEWSTANKKERKIENKAEKKKLLESAEKGAPTDKKSKKKRKSASKDISAEDQKAETPAKKLLKSSEKSAPTAKKSSSEDEDSPSEDISADQKDTKMVVNDDSHFLIYDRFPHKNKILPKDSKTLFTKNIACPPGRKITQADFEKFFRKVGKVVNVQIKLKDYNEKFVELAEIEFESHDVAKRALKKRHYHELFGTMVCLDVSREGSGPNYNKTDCTNERAVIRIDFGVEDLIVDGLHDELKDIFESCGEIMNVTASCDDETSISDGYAFVVFKYFESLSKALDLDGTEFMGAPMKITRPRVFVTSI